MDLYDFIAEMERIAPKELALDYDNVGLLIGPESREISRVLVALDCTVPVAEEAVSLGAELVLTHHPLFFNPVKRILPAAPETAAAYKLIRNGIGLFSAHTNLDAAPGGVNDVLANMLGLHDVQPMPPEGVGRIGELPEPISAAELARRVGEMLHADVRCTGEPGQRICRVAVLGGNGGSDLYAAKDAGADAYITGELKHNQAIDANTLGLNVIQAGHYETERVVLAPLIKHLQGCCDRVEYILSMRETAPLRAWTEEEYRL